MKSWAPGSLFILLKILEGIANSNQIWYSSINQKSGRHDLECERLLVQSYI